MNNYCAKCGGLIPPFIYSGTGARICNCSTDGGTAGPLPSYTPWSQPIYQHAQDLCGGHCWCKRAIVKTESEDAIGSIKEIIHEECCNCGLKRKK